MSHERIIPGAETLKQKITPEQARVNIETMLNKVFDNIQNIPAHPEIKEDFFEKVNDQLLKDLNDINSRVDFYYSM